MDNIHHRIKGERVTMVEKTEGTVEESKFPHSNCNGFLFVLLLKMDEVYIISNIYMDEAGIPMLVSMSQYKNGDQGSNKVSRSIHIIGST